MQKLTVNSYRHMVWKNGGGNTTERAISPQDATLLTFDWRISSALVAMPGPFSAFAGIDRSLVILNGAAMVLQLPNSESKVLEVSSTPFVFAGEIAVTASLPAGPVTDFNVMTRRARCRHALAPCPVIGTKSIAAQGDLLILSHVNGDNVVCQDQDSGEEMTLLSGETLILRRDDAIKYTLTAQRAMLFAVDLTWN